MAETTDTNSIDINLELFTEPRRRMFKVDGTPYYIRNFDEFNVIEQFEFQETLKELNTKPETLEANQKWRTTLHGLFDQVVVGTELKEKLNDDQKMKVVRAFLKAGPATPANPPSEVPPPTESTKEPQG